MKCGGMRDGSKVMLVELSGIPKVAPEDVKCRPKSDKRARAGHLEVDREGGVVLAERLARLARESRLQADDEDHAHDGPANRARGDADLGQQPAGNERDEDGGGAGDSGFQARAMLT